MVNNTSLHNHAELCLHTGVSCAGRAWMRASHTLSVCMNIRTANEALSETVGISADTSDLMHVWLFS